MENFNESIFWHGVDNDQSYTGDFIKQWSLFNKDRKSSMFYAVANIIWDKYFGEERQYDFPPGRNTYYHVERMSLEMAAEVDDVYKTVWLERDTVRSPRKRPVTKFV